MNDAEREARQEAEHRAEARDDYWVLTDGRHLEGPMTESNAHYLVWVYVNEHKSVKLLMAVEDLQE